MMIIKQLRSEFNGSWQYILFSINVKKFIYIFEDRLGHVLMHFDFIILFY